MVILPLCPFPPPWWWKQVLEGNAVIDLGEHYVHQTLRNRFHILGPQGIQVLTVPVLGQRGKKVAAGSIRVSAHGKWQREHLGAIRAAYGKSAGYPHLEEALEGLYGDSGITLMADFSRRSISILSAWAGIDQPVFSETYLQPGLDDHDARPLFRRHGQLPALPAYTQVFADRMSHVAGLSLLDAAMNLGPLAAARLEVWKIEGNSRQ